jgi:Rps23 Pro-64 3,4-dihydroxylase Tpa1-like proline 4-hydroxylase
MLSINKNVFNVNLSLKYKKIFFSNLPINYLVIDNFLTTRAANKAISSFKISPDWTNYSLVNNFKKFGLNDPSKIDKHCLSIFNELGSKKFLNILSRIVGIDKIFLDKTLEGGGLHQIFNGGHLNIHTDFSSHPNYPKWRRVLNIIIYLNKNWKKNFKGNLEFWDKDVKNKIASIEPIFNRCVIFRTNNISFHGHPEKLVLPKNESRKSLAAYYFIKESRNVSSYSTNFVGRPGDKFKYKIYINIENKLNSIFLFLKRKKIVNDRFASKILNIFKNL